MKKVEGRQGGQWEFPSCCKKIIGVSTQGIAVCQSLGRISEENASEPQAIGWGDLRCHVVRQELAARLDARENRGRALVEQGGQ